MRNEVWHNKMIIWASWYAYVSRRKLTAAGTRTKQTAVLGQASASSCFVLAFAKINSFFKTFGTLVFVGCEKLFLTF